jgi:tripartite-type tricarboxylate transporter receptor subunit TctC
VSKKCNAAIRPDLSALLVGGMLLACNSASFAAAATVYPDRPIRFVVGFPPGGTADVLARAIGRELAESWGQPVVLDNRPGAGSMIGSELVAKSPADGYTLLMVTSSHAVATTVARNSAYHPVDSFTPITLVAATPLALIGNLSAPVKSMRELIAYARANPGQLNFGSSGSGSTTHLAGELLNTMAGIRLVHVPYRGGAPSMNELIGGQIQLLVISWPSAMPQIKALRVSGMGITSAKRSISLPDVPTFAESGVPGYEAVQWYAVLAPKGMPSGVAQKLNTEITRIIRIPKVAEFISALGADPKSSTLPEFDAYLRTEVARWTKIAQHVSRAVQ